MDKIHNWINTGLIVLVALLVLVGGNQSVPQVEENLAGTRFPSGISADSTSPSTGEVRGTTLTVTGAASIAGTLTTTGAFEPSAITFPSQSIATTSDTLVAGDLGDTVFVTAASGTTITLPAATDGAFFRFVIASLFDTANVIIDSAEGDNIEGALIVAGAVVDCDAEDQINFVNDGENLGDFVELTSDGTSWFIGASGALTTAKLTCTDPS